MNTLISKYKILKKHNLIIEFHKGALDIDSFINFKIKLTEDPLFTNSLNYYINFKNVTFILSENDVDKYIHFLKDNSDYLGKRKVALITNTPNQVVYSTFFKLKRSNSLQSIEVFSTSKSALNWLGIKNISINEFKNILKELN